MVWARENQSLSEAGDMTALPHTSTLCRQGLENLQEPPGTRIICTGERPGDWGMKMENKPVEVQVRGLGFPTLKPDSLLSLSTVCKPRSPKPVAPVAPPFSSSSGVLGNGLCELDRLLQELNATQFNITGNRVVPEQSLMGRGQSKAGQSLRDTDFSKEQLKDIKPALAG